MDARAPLLNVVEEDEGCRLGEDLRVILLGNDVVDMVMCGVMRTGVSLMLSGVDG